MTNLVVPDVLNDLEGPAFEVPLLVYELVAEGRPGDSFEYAHDSGCDPCVSCGPVSWVFPGSEDDVAPESDGVVE